MTVSLNITHDTSAGVLAELQALFPQLVAGSGTATTAVEPKTRAPRGSNKKTEAGEAGAGESSTTDTASSSKAEESPNASTTASDTGPTSTAEVVDIEIVRAKLKALGATDGLGHDKVFEVLGKYGAKNASTVPETKRADVIAEIDALIAAVKA